MEDLFELLRRGREALNRFRDMSMELGSLPRLSVLLIILLLAFGLLNCFLGYRLLRFWFMLVGFALGAGGGFAICWYADIPTDHRRAYVLAMIAAGIGLAALTFFWYKAGIFLVVAALGIVVSVYVIYPNSSAMFYLCLLIGAALGLLALRFERPVIVFITSLFGGALAGYCLGKLLSVEEIPYGMAMAGGLVLVGMLIQMLINPAPTRDEDERDEERALRRQEARAARKVKGNSRSENDEFYSQFLEGEDVFDSRKVPRVRKNR